MPRVFCFSIFHSFCTAYGADLSLEVTDSGFTRIGLDDLRHHILVEFYLSISEPVYTSSAMDRVQPWWNLLVRICFGIKCCKAICRFSRVVYPDRYMVSIRSKSGGGIVSRLLAVAMKRTLLRSIGMLM